MKIGLDFHGVIDAAPSFFSWLSNSLIKDGHEVHIITGHELTSNFIKKLYDLNIRYTHVFSIADHHKSIGTKMWYDEKHTPWMDEETWNRTKGEYCAREEIDFHIDDSEKYCKHFITPYFLFSLKALGLPT